MRVPSVGSLKLTPKGRDFLKAGSFLGRSPGVFARKTGGKEDTGYDAKLFEELRVLRLKLAAEQRVPPYVIFHDSSLIDMARHFPQTPEQFMSIQGVGPRKMERFGESFLAVIQAYCEVNSILVPKFPPVKTRGSSASKVSARTQEIWERYQAGVSIESLASEMEVQPMTIFAHLEMAFHSGKAVRKDGLLRISTLTESDAKLVMNAFNELGAQRLKPVFEALQENVSYEQIKLWRLIFYVENNERE
jgi:ATP-dependent DNA helicase RecQ